jgi:hypothetical protein
MHSANLMVSSVPFFFPPCPTSPLFAPPNFFPPSLLSSRSFLLYLAHIPLFGGNVTRIAPWLSFQPNAALLYNAAYVAYYFALEPVAAVGAAGFLFPFLLYFLPVVCRSFCLLSIWRWLNTADDIPPSRHYFPTHYHVPSYHARLNTPIRTVFPPDRDIRAVVWLDFSVPRAWLCRRTGTCVAG